MTKETWKQIPYPLSKYEVSDLGRVFNGEIPEQHFVQYKNGNRRDCSLKNLYLKSDSQFRKEEYAEGRAGFMLEEYESAFDEYIFGTCVERRTW